MNNTNLINLPMLIICSKVDLVDDLYNIKPSTLMNELTINLKKAQCILFSSKTGYGIEELNQWIFNSVKPIDIRSYFEQINNDVLIKKK